MATQNIQTHSGNRIFVEFDGVRVGLIESLRATDNYSLEPASGIGDARVQEYVPGMARHTLTVRAMALKRKNLQQVGIVPEGSSQALRGLEFDIVIIDKDTNRIVRKYLGCSCDNSDTEVTKHQIITKSAVFMARDVSGVDL